MPRRSAAFPAIFKTVRLIITARDLTLIARDLQLIVRDLQYAERYLQHTVIDLQRTAKINRMLPEIFRTRAKLASYPQ